MSKQDPTAERAWAAIEDEKRRDRFLKRVSRVAWSVTFVILVAYTIMMGMQVAQVWKLMAVGAAGPGNLPFLAVIGAAMPLLIVLGLLAVLIATLSTIGMFLRMRTASLTEIQLRLAAIESIIAAQDDEA